MHLKLFQKIEEEVTLLNTFKEGNITVTLKADKDTTKKENHRSVSLINTDAGILNKILGKQIQQYIKRVICYNQAGFIPGMERRFKTHTAINVLHHL